MQYLKGYQKKFCIFSPNFFFMKKKKKKNDIKTKTCSIVKNQNLNPACVVRSNLSSGRGSELPRQRISRLTCFFYHPHQIPAEIFPQDNNRKYGDKTNMVPRIQSM
jgi:hypothetical protein